MISRTLVFILFSGALAANGGTPQHQPTKEQAPPSPYIDKGACPFECCTYREWTAKEAIDLVDQPNGKRVVGQLHKGEKVQGVTGEVHSIPLRVVALNDDPDAKVKAGDVIYVLHYLGEGAWQVWHKGELVVIENFSDKGPFPRATWWVQIKTASGVVGWAISHGNFSNQDSCG
jgi:hypothetical protein